MGERSLLTCLASLVAFTMAIALGATVVLGGSAAGACGPDTGTGAVLANGHEDPVAGFDGEQVTNATKIVQVGADLGVPLRGWIIAVAVTITESGLRNLDHGDSAGPDSRGLFQQRSGWGPAAQRMDPAGSARLFYTGGHGGQQGLLDIPGWAALPLTVAGHDVQHNADPQAYAGKEASATALVAYLVNPAINPAVKPARPGNGTAFPRRPAAPGSSPGPAAGIGAAGQLRDSAPTCTPAGDTRTAQVIAYARAQLGVPYRWGGDGPGTTRLASGRTMHTGGFDCSGLTRAAYAAAGIHIPRTAQAQFDAGPHLPAGSALQPGDLVFYGTAARVHHVGLYMGRNQMIDAPHSGAVVRIEDFRWKDYLGAARP